MIERNEIEKADRAQAKREALGVLAEMNGMLRRMPISEAVKKERFGRLQNRLNSLGWLGLCDERTTGFILDFCANWRSDFWRRICHAADFAAGSGGKTPMGQ